jgi:glutathione S-transferase
MITVTALKMVPPFAQGLVRDLRVRWALEEAGMPYQVRLLSPEEQQSSAYRSMQPFGQVPALEADGLILFESGAIVLYIANQSDKLLPVDPAGRARATAWVFAALNSVEQHIQNLVAIDLFYAKEDWAKQRRPGAEEMATARLACVSQWLGDKTYLEGGQFTAGDLMMATVLRIPRHTDIVAQFPNLRAYLNRCEARPAFQRALAAQLAGFSQSDA